MRPPPSPYTDADDDWTYSETIDEATSAIRVRGLVDRLGVDLLRGTIEELSRCGHRDITVSMEHRDDVNACARGVLAEVAARLAADQGRLTIRWTADQTGRPTAPLGDQGHHSVDGQGGVPGGRRANTSRRPDQERPRHATGGHGGN